MKAPGRHRARRQRVQVPLIAAVVALLGCGVYFGIRSSGSAHGSAAVVPSAVAPPTTQPTTSAPIPGVTPLVASASRTAAAAVSPPVHLTVASIGVDTALQPLGLLADGTLESPPSWDVAGWYAGGVTPGQIGPAVIAGHIDSTKGPAVFYRLDHLVAGDQAVVTDQDGTVLTFVVDDVQSFPKNTFPAGAVYGPTPYPELRLITCTGDFDYATHNYLNNLVVSTHLISGGPS